MKQSSVAALIGIIIFLMGMEILLIYIACTTQANEDITLQYKDVNKEKTIVPTTTSTTTTLSSTTMPSENSTRGTTTSQTEDKTESSTVIRTTIATTASSTTSPSEKTNKTTSMQSTTSTSCRCKNRQMQKCKTSPTHSSPSKRTYPYSTITDAIKTTTNVTKNTLITTTPSTITTTFVTNSTIFTTTVSEIPNTTSTVSPFIPTITEMTTTMDASETNVTGKSSTFITTTMTFPPPFPPPTVSYPPVTEVTTSPASTNCKTYVTADTTTTITTRDMSPTRITIPKFNYVLRDEKGVDCVLANMTIRINLPYATKGSKVLNVPVNARTEGTCNEKTANMILSWEEPAKNQVGSNNRENNIIFNYAHDDIKFFLDSIFVNVHLNDKRIKNTTDRRLQLFSAALNNGIFICKANTIINVRNEIHIGISNIYLIVFNKCLDNCTKTETNCIYETNKIIAIIGAVIIGILLFMIIFVSYLIWYMQKKGIAQDFI